MPNNICRKTQESKGKITNFRKIAIVFPPQYCTCYWAKYLFFFYIFNKVINYNDLNKTLWIYWVTYTSFVTNRICAVSIELRLWLNLSNFLNDKWCLKFRISEYLQTAASENWDNNFKKVVSVISSIFWIKTLHGRFYFM